MDIQYFMYTIWERIMSSNNKNYIYSYMNLQHSPLTST